MTKDAKPHPSAPETDKKAPETTVQSGQDIPKSTGFRLSRLGSLSQVGKAQSRIIRKMAAGELDTLDGSRICGSLDKLRATLETQHLERLQQRLDEAEKSGGSGATVTPFPRAVGK